MIIGSRHSCNKQQHATTPSSIAMDAIDAITVRCQSAHKTNTLYAMRKTEVRGSNQKNMIFSNGPKIIFE
jgi:hypothetical protein